MQVQWQEGVQEYLYVAYVVPNGSIPDASSNVDPSGSAQKNSTRSEQRSLVLPDAPHYESNLLLTLTKHPQAYLSK